MTAEEQTEEAALEYSCGFDHATNAFTAAAFIVGAEWERQRDKWIYVKKREDLPPPGKYFTVTVFSELIQLRDFPDERFSFEFNRHWWLVYVKCYQPFPELPKQK